MNSCTWHEGQKVSAYVSIFICSTSTLSSHYTLYLHALQQEHCHQTRKIIYVYIIDMWDFM
jgi:hypothetical protein